MLRSSASSAVSKAMRWYDYNQACENICERVDNFCHWTTDHIPAIMITTIGLGLVAVIVISYLRFG